jgi:hypothetical protein
VIRKKTETKGAFCLSKKFRIPDNSTILFQGDSITDSERKNGHNESLGDGYVMMTVAWLSGVIS